MGADTSTSHDELRGSTTVGGAPRSGRVGWYVISAAILVGIVMGVFLFTRAKGADIAIRQWFIVEAERGKALSGTGCVDDVLDWFQNRCEAPQEMCVQAVSMGVAHCLKAVDRAEDCKAIGTDLKNEQWKFKKCQALGIDKKSRKPDIKACSGAWDALDTYCRSGQKGVAL